MSPEAKSITVGQPNRVQPPTQGCSLASAASKGCANEHLPLCSPAPLPMDSSTGSSGMSERVRVGVIGCGAISGAYFKHAASFSILEIVACADLNPDAA